MNSNVFRNINRLVSYGLNTGLIAPEDKIYTCNRLMELLGLEELEAENYVNCKSGKDSTCYGENSGFCFET